MSLVKDHHPTPSTSFYDYMVHQAESSLHFPHIYVPPYHFDRQQDNTGGLESPNSNTSNTMAIKKKKNISQVTSSSPSISSSSSGNYQPHYNEEFKPEFGSFLSFLNDDDDDDDHHQKYAAWETSSKDKHEDSSNNSDWLYGDAMLLDPSPESPTQPTCFNKRPHHHMEEENHMRSPNKKQSRGIGSKKAAKSGSTSKKDPQSVVAKNRRERISEKLKILQDLVPNGSKVDLVTMLEKAIGYVKFLQLQMKVLAADEFWPVAGGKAPDISQVKEAMDAILSSQGSGRNATFSNYAKIKRTK